MAYINHISNTSSCQWALLKTSFSTLFSINCPWIASLLVRYTSHLTYQNDTWIYLGNNILPLLWMQILDKMTHQLVFCLDSKNFKCSFIVWFWMTNLLTLSRINGSKEFVPSHNCWMVQSCKTWYWSQDLVLSIAAAYWLNHLYSLLMLSQKNPWRY